MARSSLRMLHNWAPELGLHRGVQVRSTLTFNTDRLNEADPASDAHWRLTADRAVPPKATAELSPATSCSSRKFGASRASRHGATRTLATWRFNYAVTLRGSGFRSESRIHTKASQLAVHSLNAMRKVLCSCVGARPVKARTVSLLDAR